MSKLHKTESGIYYLYDYVPSKQLKKRENCFETKLIWEYKNGDFKAFAYYTLELTRALVDIANQVNSEEFSLVVVPPSKTYKESTIQESVNWIGDSYKDGTIKTRFGCSKRFFDDSMLLTRVTDIPTAHLGNRASYSEQIDSIYCSIKNLSNYRDTFVILDDVTTIGTSMDVCRDILINHGVKEQDIIRLAIARTVQKRR